MWLVSFCRRVYLSIGFLVLTVLVAVPYMAVILPLITGKYWPANKEMHITWIDVYEETSAFQVTIWGEVEKLRDCRYLDIQWFKGTRGGSDAQVQIRLEEPPKVRPPGLFEVGPWVLQINWADITHDSYANVHHKCKFRGGPLDLEILKRILTPENHELFLEARQPWTTISRLYN